MAVTGQRALTGTRKFWIQAASGVNWLERRWEDLYSDEL